MKRLLINSKAVTLVAICAAIVGTSYGMHTPIVAVFAKDALGADYSEVGVIGMVNYLPYVFAPILVGLSLDRINKSFLLATGIGLNIFAIFMLSQAQSISEVLLFRSLSGISHALFWPSSELLVATNSSEKTRVKGIAIFTAAWVGGFMVGPLIGREILESFDYATLFQLSSAAIALAMIPSILLYKHGRPLMTIGEKIERHTASIGEILKEFKRYPPVGAVLLYYAITFGVILAVYPAYMRDASLTDSQIETMFFIFGIARFSALFLASRIAVHGKYALILGVLLTAVGMLVTFMFTSILSFAVALILVGLATSIFYPVSLNIVTKGIPKEIMGSKLGIYQTIFGIGWAIGPIGVGLSSDAFGASSPYFAFFIIGIMVSVFVALSQRSRVVAAN